MDVAWMLKLSAGVVMSAAVAMVPLTGCETVAPSTTVTATPTPCPGGLPGPAMVEALVPPSGSYCIDATEVTQDQYNDFLIDAADNPPNQDSFCSFNDSFVPRNNTDSCNPDSFDPVERADRPVTCVDWCDAAAYCSWAGKRLCGRVGGGGLQNSNSEPWDFSKSQWYNACSDSGQFRYPYGDSYREDVCNGADAGYGRTLPVTTDSDESGCHGVYPPYRDLFAMSGNVAEWEDGCGASQGDSDFCYVRGGSYEGDDDGSYTDKLACLGAITGYFRSDNRNPFIGFRCCLD